jgi:adenylate cyclase
MSDSGANRRLVTLLFADVAGYSRMMRADEEQTLIDLRAHLAELVAPVVGRYRGRIVKTVGDGVLVEYGSAVEAVRSAVELQRGMIERNTGVPQERRQSFRIALHLGDVIMSDEDVFGDAVNVAARLVALAEPGSIVLSDSVYEQVRDKLALPFRALGLRSVKNIDRPIRLFALDVASIAEPGSPTATERPSSRKILWAGAAVAVIVLLAGAFAFFDGRSGSESASSVSIPAVASETLSLAVLVFTNQSGDPAQDYFSDGLTEDITAALGRFKSLTVIAYKAVLSYKGKQDTPSEIGRALNARFIVGGSVRKMGDRIRVTAQLSDAANGTQLWADQYDDELTDVFAVQERIARRVAGALASSLEQIAQQYSLRKPTDNLDAYDLVLRGRALEGDATRRSNRTARELLERATQLAPSYADAHAELASAYFQRAASGWSEFPQDDIDTAIQLARKAITLDDDCVLAHSVLARVYTAQAKYDLGLAESDRALELNPSDAEANEARAAVLLWTGRTDEAIAAAETANRLNANLGPESALNLGIAYLLKRRYADAIKLLEVARIRYPAHPLLDYPLAGAYAELGHAEDAQRAVEQGNAKNPHFELASFGSRFQDRALQGQVQASLRKAGLN